MAVLRFTTTSTGNRKVNVGWGCGSDSRGGPVREGDAVRLTPFDLPFEKAPGCQNPDYPALAVEASEPVEVGRWT